MPGSWGKRFLFLPPAERNGTDRRFHPGHRAREKVAEGSKQELLNPATTVELVTDDAHGKKQAGGNRMGRFFSTGDSRTLLLKSTPIGLPE